MLHDVVEHILLFVRLLIIGFILKKTFKVSYKSGLRTIRIKKLVTSIPEPCHEKTCLLDS